MKTTLHWPTIPNISNEAFLATSLPEEVLGIIFDQVVNQNQSVQDIFSILLTCHQWKCVFDKNPCISLVQALFQLQHHPQSEIKFPQECLRVEQDKNFTSQELKLIDRFHSQQGFENLLMRDSKLFHPKSLFLSLLDHYSWNPESCKTSTNENIQRVAEEQLSILNSLILGTDDQRLAVIKHDFIEKFYLGVSQNKTNRDETWRQLERSVISTLKKFPNFNDKKVFIKCVQCFGRSVFTINDSFKKDREMVLAAVKQNETTLHYVDESFKKDQEIVLVAVKRCGNMLHHVDESFKKDREIVLAAVKQQFRILQFIDESLKKDREIVLAAVKQDGRALQYAAESLKKDRKLVLAAVKQRGEALQYADESLKKDRDFVLSAVQQRSGALEYADKSFQKDRDFVLLAVQQRGSALEYADASFRKDRDIVLAAVKQYGWALQYADASLKKDQEIVEAAAVKQNVYAFAFSLLG